MSDFETIALRLRDELIKQLKHVLSLRLLFRLLRSSWRRLCSIGTVLGTLYLIQYICYSFRKAIMSQFILLCENILWLYYLQVVVLDNRYPIVQKCKGLSARAFWGIIHVFRNMKRYCEEASKSDRERRLKMMPESPSFHDDRKEKVSPSPRSIATAETEEADVWMEDMACHHHQCGTPLHVQFEAQNEDETESCSSEGRNQRNESHPQHSNNVSPDIGWTEDAAAWQVITLMIPLLHSTGRTHEQWDVLHKELSLLLKDQAQPALSPELLAYIRKSPSFRDDIKALMINLKSDPHLVQVAVRYLEACQQTSRYQEYRKGLLSTGTQMPKQAEAAVARDGVLRSNPAGGNEKKEKDAPSSVENDAIPANQETPGVVADVLPIHEADEIEKKKEVPSSTVVDADDNPAGPDQEEDPASVESNEMMAPSPITDQDFGTTSNLIGRDEDEEQEELRSAAENDEDDLFGSRTKLDNGESSPRSTVDEGDSQLPDCDDTSFKPEQPEEEPLIDMGSTDISSALAPGKVEGSYSSALDEIPVCYEYKQKELFSIAKYRQVSPMRTKGKLGSPLMVAKGKLSYGCDESCSAAEDDDDDGGDDKDDDDDDGKLPGYQTAWKQRDDSSRNSIKKRVGFDESSFVTDDEPSSYDEYTPSTLSLSKDNDMYGYGGYDGSYTDADEDDLDYGYG